MRQGWEIKKLGDIGTFQRGGGFLKSDFVEDGYPCVHYGQIHTKFGVKTYNHLTCISEELALSKSKIANSGDIIIAITSEDVEGSCKCTAWLGDYDVAVGGHAAIFKHGLNPAFVAYYFRGPYFNTAKKVYAHGSKVVEIRPADIATINISYPSLSEQEKIVAELDCLSGIIEKKKQQLKELDNLAQSIFYEMFGDPVENDKGWKVKKIGEVCIVERGGSPRPINAFITDDENGVNWIKIGDATEGGRFITSTKEKIIPEGVRKSRMVYKGDFILSNSMSFGRPYIMGIDGCIHDGWLVLRDKDNVFDKTYLYYYLGSSHVYQEFKRLAVGGVVNNLNSELVRGVRVAIPSFSVQQDFASKIESIEKQKELIAQSIKETEILFNSRMDYYFN